MDYEKDNPREMFWAGIVAPAAILGLVVFNLTYHRVYWLCSGRFGSSSLVVYTIFWPMLGILVMKLGVAGFLCSWYLLSDLEKMERYAPILTGVSEVVAGAGLAIFFVWLWRATLLPP